MFTQGLRFSNLPAKRINERTFISSLRYLFASFAPRLRSRPDQLGRLLTLLCPSARCTSDAARGLVISVSWVFSWVGAPLVAVSPAVNHETKFDRLPPADSNETFTGFAVTSPPHLRAGVRAKANHFGVGRMAVRPPENTPNPLRIG